jgi:signal transduction histidine kinase
MKTFRRSAVVLAILALWTAPYVFPFQSLGVSLVGRFGGALWVAPHTFPFAEARHRAAAGWYVALALCILWPLVLVWNVVEELPQFEAKRKAKWPWPWWLTLVVGIALAGVSWIVWPSLCFWCVHWDTFSSVNRVHHVALVEGGIALALPSAVVLASGALGRPVDVRRTPLHRWSAAVAGFLFVSPPFLLLAKSSQLILYALAILTMWVRELPSLEEKSPLGRTRVRIAAIALGSITLLPVFLFSGPLLSLVRERLLPIVHVGALVVVAGGGLSFVGLCMSAADGLAWAMRGAPSVRARMLVLGLSSAGLAFALAGVYVPISVVGQDEPSLVLTLVGKLVCLGFIVAVFSATLSRKFARSLEQSVRAIAEIRRGNLEVTLDDSGKDEVAAVARSFNQLIAVLREAEFLEKINADLRARSAQLATTLEALQTAQADLVRSERMASVAVLVKGIAHELNNPINYIAGNIAPLRRYCEFLTAAATELSDGRARTPAELRRLTHLTEKKDLSFVAEDLSRLTDDIGEGARRAHLIISDLQSLTMAAQRDLEQVDLHRVVRQTISLLDPGVPPGVRLEAELKSVSALTARAGQLEQVLVNLTDNALRAVGNKGTVRIYVGEAARQAVVKVSDDGSGMSTEVKRQAFDPFFTTRPPGEGSGLGLAIVASIVRAHRGTVTLTSEPGKGTEVELRFPLHSDLSVAGVSTAQPVRATGMEAGAVTLETRRRL